jgi:hypothetical protein
MLMKISRALFVTFSLFGSAAFAQFSGVDPAPAIDVVPPPVVPTRPPVPPPPSAVELPAASGETSLALDVGFGIRPVLPSRVTVPNGERLRVTAPDLGDNITYIWTKNGRAIGGASGRVLTIDSVNSSDAGTYVCLFSTPATMPGTSQTLVLGVGPTDRLLNISTRGNVTPAQGVVSGFVVASGAQPKKLIVRAIGPSLSLFGVAGALRQPALKIFDGDGTPYEAGYVYPAVVGGPTYESDLAESLAKTGAFPVPSGAGDVVIMMPFKPGAYTAHVTSGDGTSGAVLLEIYEVP